MFKEGSFEDIYNYCYQKSFKGLFWNEKTDIFVIGNTHFGDGAADGFRCPCCKTWIFKRDFSCFQLVKNNKDKYFYCPICDKEL